MEKGKVSIRSLAILGMLSGIIVLLAYTPIGLIPLGPISASTIHIPVIVGAIILGPKKGAVLGGIMGTVTLIKSLTAAGWMDQFFKNPLVSVLPRIFIGITAYYVYLWLKNVFKKDVVAYIGGSIIGAFTNTILTLGALLVAISSAYPDKLNEAAALAVTLISTSAVVEVIITAVIVSPIVYALKKLRY